MTAGYHQIPMHPDSIPYTAFITFMGVYSWLFIPFGLKGAPAYFQMLMTSVVLAGLIYIILEIYIDDLIIHGQTELELLNNVREVFKRFLQYKLKFHPKKCTFGVSEVNCVGHTISAEGISFPKKKTDFVINFQKPMTHKDLKSFLGMATYFHTHIRNFSIIVRPLHEIIHHYEKATAKRKLINWNDDSNKAYNTLIQELNDLPTLFFLTDNKEVFLETDASDYAIGAFLHQTIDGVQKPIAFISKTLTLQEQRWDTIDKEAFAIYYAFLKLEYLIRDIHFTLKTDHKNLTYINNDYKGRVKRWKLAIQDYTFDVEHVPGKDNIVADGLS